MAIVARGEEVYNDLLLKKCDIMKVSDESILFQPENCTLKIEDVNKNRIDMLRDYDIVEINNQGILYRAFANYEADSTIFMGAKCNSNCIMCPASDIERKQGFSYSHDMLLKYIDYLPEDIEYIVITGGEPTMQTALFLEVLDRVREKYSSTQVLLLTNGRSLSDNWLFEQVCIRHPSNFRVAIPIHGSTSKLHDYITRAPGSFDQTILALKKLMHSHIKIEIRIVVTKTNCDNLLEIAKLITNLFPRVFCVNFVALEPRGNCALNFGEVYIDHRSSFLKSKPAVQHLISEGYDVGLYNYPLCAVDKDFWPIAARSISQYKNIFHPNCKACAVKQICGGFFTATLSIAKPNVVPVIIEEENRYDKPL
jgi:His-Xaa-Ser system radical SAM maturase HxsC